MISAVMLSKGLHTMYAHLNQELGEYVEANALREEIADYVDRYPTYEEAKMIYEERGIKRSWMQMLYTFLTGDANHFSSKDLKRMVDLKQASKKTVEEYIDTFKGHKLMWAAVILWVGVILIRKGVKNSIVPLLGCMVSLLMVSLYFVYIGRFAWRVTNGCILACVISFVVMTSVSVCPAVHLKLNVALKTGILAVIAMMFLAEGISVKKENSMFVMPKATVLNQNLADTLAYMDANSGTLYLTIDSGFRFYSAYNMWAFHEPEYLDNSFSLVAHFIFGGRDALADRGIEDLVQDMLEQSGIYCKYSPKRSNVFYDYLRDYYEPHVVDRITTADGATLENIEPRILKQTISQSTSETIKEFCNTVVTGEHGTGKTARPAGYMIGGKTGTAETLPRKNNEYVVSFMGYAPADDPEIAIYVVVDRPNVFMQDDAKHATRIVKKVLTEVLPYLNIFMTEELSDKEREELEEMQIQIKRPAEGTEELELDEEGNPVLPKEGDGEAGGEPKEEETEEEKAAREIWKTFPKDPETGYLKDPNTGNLYDPETGTQVGGSLLGEEGETDEEEETKEGEDVAEDEESSGTTE